MNSYIVSWQVEVDADTPEDAVTQACEMLPVDGRSTATFFDVLDPEDDSLIEQIDISKL
jgi:hypothetical protein